LGIKGLPKFSSGASAESAFALAFGTGALGLSGMAEWFAFKKPNGTIINSSI
jgi:hypothetical protein